MGIGKYINNVCIELTNKKWINLDFVFFGRRFGVRLESNLDETGA